MLSRTTQLGSASRVRGLSVVLGLFALVWAMAPTSAEAHASLVSSSPEDGATIDTLPPQVTFTFDEPVAAPAFVSVIAPDGTRVDEGEPEILDATLTSAVKPVDERGTYTMAYRIVSDDGHPITGTLTFIVTSGDTVAQVPPPAGASVDTNDDGGTMGRSTVMGVTAIVAVVIAVALFIIIGRGPGRGREAE